MTFVVPVVVAIASSLNDMPARMSTPRSMLFQSERFCLAEDAILKIQILFNYS